MLSFSPSRTPQHKPQSSLTHSLPPPLLVPRPAASVLKKTNNLILITWALKLFYLYLRLVLLRFYDKLKCLIVYSFTGFWWHTLIIFYMLIYPFYLGWVMELFFHLFICLFLFLILLIYFCVRCLRLQGFSSFSKYVYFCSLHDAN